MSAAACDVSGGFVLVAVERLRALEALEAEMPRIVAKAKEEAHDERFASLRARDKEDPEAHKKRSAVWREKHKEEYNAKRREQYRLKKENVVTLAATKPPGVSSAAALDP
jgi:hypothetical protein